MAITRGWIAVRPIAFAAIVLAIAVVLIRALPPIDPTDRLMRYVLEVATIGAVAVGGAASWWALRSDRTWDADLWPALIGGVAAISLLGLLRGTPFSLNGLQFDQSFRTESITRFANTFQLVDFVYKGEPAFYAPAFFWVLGRAADLLAIEPWRILKPATIATTMAIPVISYLLWRRHLPARSAALVSAVPLLVQNAYEPYAWLVLVSIVPWWLEVVQGPSRPGARPWSPQVLGLIGGALFLTYYLFFFVALLAVVLHLVVVHASRSANVRGLDRRAVRRAVIGVGVFALTTAVFWLPLGLSILAAGHGTTEANRYFPPGGGEALLPFLEATPVGLICLVGLGYLIATARHDQVSRGLLTFLVAVGAWFVLGLGAALLDHPLVTFRSAPFLGLILMIAGVIAAIRIAARIASQMAAARTGARYRPEHNAIAGMLAILFLYLAGHSFLVAMATSGSFIVTAWAERLPNGQPQRYGAPPANPGYISEHRLEAVIQAGYHGAGPPVLLSTRDDLMDLTTAYGFVPTRFYYSHPAGKFTMRMDFLRSAATLSAREFARATAQNPFDRIDAFVLRAAGPDLVFDYYDDNFPHGSRAATAVFARTLFDPADFVITDLGQYVVAVRR